MMTWGFSSVGRALRWQRRGQGFEPPKLHHINRKALFQGFFYYIRYFAHKHSVHKDIHAGKKIFSFHRLRIGNQRKNRYNNTGYYLYKKEKRFDDVLYAKYY